MDMTGFTGSNYFRAEDLEPGTLIKATIVSVALREFKDGEPKAVVYTDYQGKGVVLNKTRAQVLYAAFGPNSDNWIGKPIIIRLGETMFAGKKVGAVVIEAVVATRISAEQRPALGAVGRRGSSRHPQRQGRVGRRAADRPRCRTVLIPTTALLRSDGGWTGRLARPASPSDLRLSSKADIALSAAGPARNSFERGPHIQ